MPTAFNKKDFNSTFWFSLQKLIHLLASIYIIPKIFNTIGTVDIGKLKYVEAILGMFSPLFFLGLSAICIREIIYKPEKTQLTIATAFFMQLFSWVFIFLGTLLYLFFIENTSLFWLYVIISISYLFRLGDVFEYYFLAKKEAKFIFTVKTLSLLIIVGLQYYGVKNQLNIIYFASVLALDFLLQGAFYFLIMFYKKHLDFKKWKFSFTYGKQLLKMAFPLIITEALIMFYIGIDELFIKHFLGNHANGVFASVQFLVIGLSWTIGFAIVNALYPSLAESYTENSKLYYKKNLQLITVMSLLGILIVILYNLFGNYIVTNHFSIQFNDARLPLKIFCWAPLFVFLGMVYEKHLLTTNRLEHNVYRFIVGCIINIILCYFLIPAHGIIGAAFSVVLSHFVTNVLYAGIDLAFRKL